MPTFEIDDLVRGTRVRALLDVEASVGDSISTMLHDWNLPRRTFRRRSLGYQLVHDGNVLDDEATLASAGVTDGNTLQLVSPQARVVWERVQHLMGRVERDLRVEVRKHKDRAISSVRAEVNDAVDEAIEKITQPIDDLRDTLSGLVEETTDALADDLRRRIDGIKSRVLDEISTRLRGGKASIPLTARVRARLDLAKLSRTGVLGDHGLPLRKSIGRLAAIGLERTAAAALIGGGIVAIGAVALADGAPEPTDATTTRTTTTTATTTVTSTPVTAPTQELNVTVPSEANAGDTVVVSWRPLLPLDDLTVNWDLGEDRILTASPPATATSYEITLPIDSPRQVNITVKAMRAGLLDEDQHTVIVNRPPNLPDQTVSLPEGVEQPVDITMMDPDLDDVIELRISDSPFAVTISGDPGDHSVVIDAKSIGGPTIFGFCLTVTDGKLEDRGWISVEVTPVVSPGDSLWVIARRMLVAESRISGADAENPTTPAINNRMRELRLNRWLTDPSFIDTSDVIHRWQSAQPVPTRPDGC